jgi:hypothetical protein
MAAEMAVGKTAAISCNRRTKNLTDIGGKFLPSNCPVTKANILATEDIKSPDVVVLKGKTTH